MTEKIENSITIENNFIFKKDMTTLSVSEASLITFIIDNEAYSKKENYNNLLDELYEIRIKQFSTFNTTKPGMMNTLSNTLLLVTVTQGRRIYEILLNGIKPFRNYDPNRSLVARFELVEPLSPVIY